MSILRSDSRRALALLISLALAACADRAPTTAAEPQAVAPGAGPVASHQVGTGTHVINLGVSGGAVGINDAGQVAGSTTPSGGKPKAFVWTPATPYATTGVMQFLPALSVRDSSVAAGLNENGQVAGISRNPLGRERAALWTPNGSGGYTVKDLGVIAYPGLHSWGMDVSNAGHVTGYAHNAARAVHAFLWTPNAPGDTAGVMQDLGTLGGTRSEGMGVNSSGWVAGTSTTSGGNYRAFLWTPGTGMISLGTLPGQVNSYATAINDAGQVVGRSGANAFLWTPSAPGATTGTMRDLGRLPTWQGTSSRADGLNDQQVVVGSAVLGSHTLPMIWTEEGGMRDLPTDGTSGQTGAAHDVNNLGHVTGWTKIRENNGLLVDRVVIWRGVASNSAPVAALSYPPGLVSGHRYEFDASGSTDPDGDALKYEWVYWRGSTPYGTGSAASKVAIKLDSAGEYSLRLIVTDDDNLADTIWTTLTVEQNLPPQVSVAGGPITVGEGVPAVIPLNVSDPNQTTDTTEVSGLYYHWVWGDGTESVGRGGRKYADQGVYTVRLYVTDRGGMIDSLTTQVTVTNLPPSAVVSATNTTYEGSTYTITASSPHDPGLADRPTLQFAFDCGRGGGYGAFSTTRTMTCPALADQDTFHVRARVRDKDGAETEYIRTVRVNNARPVVEARLADPNAPQGPVAFRFTDAGTADGPWQYRVRRANGTYTAWMPATPGEWITTPAYSYPSGSHNEAVYVRDKDNGIGYSAPVTLVVP